MNFKKLFEKKKTLKGEEQANKVFGNFKQRFGNFSDKAFGKLQNLSRAIVLPVAVLPVAGFFLGIGGGFASAAQQYHWPDGVHKFFLIMKAAGDVVFGNLGLIFCISIAFGFAKKSRGVAALSAFIAFVVMTGVIHGMFFPTTKNGVTTLGFDPWKLAGSSHIADKNSGIFSSILGLFPTIDTSVFGGILLGWVMSIVHNKTYNIKMPRVLAFFQGERFVPIAGLLVGVVAGVISFFVWPALLLAFSETGKGVGAAMNTTYSGTANGQLTGNQFSPTAAGAFAAFFLGALERLLIPTGLHHVLYTPFWFTSVGGTWNAANGDQINGAYNIFFEQLGSNGTGHMNLYSGSIFMSGRFAFMDYGYPMAALAMYKLAKPERKKIVGGILLSAGLTSFLTGITEPILYTFVFVAPLLFAFHAFMAGISFMMCYCLNVVVGQGFSGGIIDFTFFGIVPQAQGKETGFYWIFLIGAIMAPAYYFGFYYIIKWKDYKTIGREDGEMAANIAFGAIQDTLDKSTKKAKSKPQYLYEGLGGFANINLIKSHDDYLTVEVKDGKIISKPLLRLSGTKTIKNINDNTFDIRYLTNMEDMKSSLNDLFKAKTKIESSVSQKKKAGSKKELTKQASLKKAQDILKGLGGKENIETLGNCATRLRVNVKDMDKVDKALLQTTGPSGIVVKGNSLQIIYGLDVPNIKNDVENLM